VGKTAACKTDTILPDGEERVVAADARTRGNLVVRGMVVVLGDLAIDGVLRVELGASVVVIGNLSAKAAIRSEGMLLVNGDVSAPLVFLAYNQGFAKMFGSCQARMLVEADHGGSRIVGPLRAEIVETDELQLAARARRSRIDGVLLAPPDEAPLGAEWAALATDLADRLERGERVFR
jgi:hypothetical protein